jgi:hypothetical protein
VIVVKNEVKVNSVTTINLRDLEAFIVKAKMGTYAADRPDVANPERKGFSELIFEEGPWSYRDSYFGYYRAPGEEVVRYNGTPVWRMAYNGGMVKRYWGKNEFTHSTFSFLQKALRRVDVTMPYRGPARFEEGDFSYECTVRGRITHFSGREVIKYKGGKVFVHDFFGGIYVQKD